MHSEISDIDYCFMVPLSHNILILYAESCAYFQRLHRTALKARKSIKIAYFRGDHKQPDKRTPIAAKIIAGMLETAGTSQVQSEQV